MMWGGTFSGILPGSPAQRLPLLSNRWCPQVFVTPKSDPPITAE